MRGFGARGLQRIEIRYSPQVNQDLIKIVSYLERRKNQAAAKRVASRDNAIAWITSQCLHPRAGSPHNIFWVT